MSKKRSKRPGGHYCKICGEYKVNEKFSGKGHAAHICKSCSRLSAAEKAEAMTINRLMNLPLVRLSASDKKWLENRVHDRRPEVASIAREVYNMHFPYAERNERKKRLLINTLAFELNHVTVYDEFGDERSISMRFTASRLTNLLTMTDFDADGVELSITLEKRQMAKLLRWTVHTLEVFMWPEDYDLSPDDPFFDGPLLDLLPEYWPEDLDTDEEDDKDPVDNAPEAEIFWRVQIEYADETEQNVMSYQDYLFDKPAELLFVLSEYFQVDADDSDEGFDDEQSGE